MSLLDYLYGRLNYERVAPPSDQGAFRLQRMRHLLRLLEHPERCTHVIHVGGTKGKGSTCEMISAMLVAAGRCVGLYTSPHLERLEERFRVDGEPCTADQLETLIDAVRGAAEGVEKLGEGVPTFFELTTAMAFEHFRRSQCEVSVVEVGLGGRLDSTNVCDPVVSVLTSVGLDHQHLLGDTIQAIAGEKAGIIKPGVPVVSGFTQPEAVEVVRQTARRRGAPLWQLGVDFEVRSDPEDPVRCDLISHHPGITARRGWAIGLEGRHQHHNAAVALTVMDALQPIALSAPHEAQRRALAEVRCWGRIERFSGSPEILLDTAHNVDSVAALRTVLRDRPPAGKTVVVFGTSVDKDAEGMLELLSDTADLLLLTRYWSNPRWYDPVELARMIATTEHQVILQPLDALRHAVTTAGRDGRVVICGSFFLAAELRPQLTARSRIDASGSSSDRSDSAPE